MSGFQRSTLCSSLFALVLLIGVVSSTNASAQTVRNLRPGSPEFLERCKSWIERKGFPVDYIEQKTGKRQPGFAVDWKGNVKPDDARAGDVAIIRRTYPDGRTIEAAGYIESVEAPVGGSGAFVTVSAMGRGGEMGGPGVPRQRHFRAGCTRAGVAIERGACLEAEPAA